MIDMPPAVAARPRDKRGYPILYTSLVVDGVPDFRASDFAKVERAARDRLCGVCGERLGYWIVFIGGPMGCVNRAFADPPMHRECAVYSINVCPYLATAADRSQAFQEKHGPLLHEMDPTLIRAKPSKLALFTTRAYRCEPNGRGLIFRAAPAKTIEWYDLKGGRGA